eukprot:gene5302-5971_t
MDKRMRPPNLNLSDLMTHKKELGRKSSLKQKQQYVLPGAGAVSVGVKRNEWKDVKEWKVVSHSVSTLFNGKRMSTSEFEKVHGIVSSCCNSEMGDLMYALYQEHILKRGMIILREDIKEKRGRSLLTKLSDIWGRFYSFLLPMLQVIFYTITTHGLSIRQLTLQSFRDLVLLKTEAREAIDSNPSSVSPALKQMLLVLLSVHDIPHPSENYLKLEAMASKVVCPLLGAKTLYVKPDSFEVNPTFKSSAESSPNLEESFVNGKKKAGRPASMVDQSDKDADFDELIQYRQQRYRNSYGGRLSAVTEGNQSLASSFGSLIDD